MLIKRVAAVNFQGYEAIDISMDAGTWCITGPNMSGKSTAARCIMWGLTGKFPYPNLGTWVKDLVRPGREMGDGEDNPKSQKGKGKIKGGSGPTVVRVEFQVTGPDGPELYTLVRSLVPDKTPSLILTATDGSEWRDEVAQDAILNLAKVPTAEKKSDRIDILTRCVWYGVGQVTSFFEAKGSERKKILERLDPFTKLAAMEREASQRIKTYEKLQYEYSQELSTINGREEFAKSELIINTPPDIKVALGDVLGSGEGLGLSILSIIDSQAYLSEKEAESRVNDALRYYDEVSLARLDASKINEITEGEKAIASEIDKTLSGRSLDSLVGEESRYLKLIEDINSHDARTRLLNMNLKNLNHEINLLRKEGDLLADRKSKVDKIGVRRISVATEAAKIKALLEGLLKGQDINPTQSTLIGRELSSESDYSRYMDSLASAVNAFCSRFGNLNSGRMDLEHESFAKCLEHFHKEVGGLDPSQLLAEATTIEARVASSRNAIGELKEIITELEAKRREAQIARDQATAIGGKINEIASAIDDVRDFGLKAALIVSKFLELRRESIDKFMGESGRSIDASKIFATASVRVKILGESLDRITRPGTIQATSSDHSDLESALTQLCEIGLGLSKKYLEVDSLFREVGEAVAEINADRLALEKGVAGHEAQIKKLVEVLEAGDGVATCSHCLSPLSEDGIKKHIIEIRDSIHSAEAEIAKINKNLSELVKERETIQSLKDTCGKEIDTNEKKIEGILNAALSALSTLGCNFSLILGKPVEERLTEMEAAVHLAHEKMAETELMPLVGDLNRAESRVEDCSKRIEEITTVDIPKILGIIGLDASDPAEIREEMAPISSALDEQLKECQLIRQEANTLAILLRDFQTGAAQVLAAVTEAAEVLGDEGRFAKLVSGSVQSESEDLSNRLNSKMAEYERILADHKEAFRDSVHLTATLAIGGENDALDPEKVWENLSRAKMLAEQGVRQQRSLQSKVRDLQGQRDGLDGARKEILSRGHSQITLRGIEYIESEMVKASENLSRAKREFDLARARDHLRRLAHKAEEAENSRKNYEQMIIDTGREIASLQVIKGILAPNGDARSLALSDTVETVVTLTNEFLSSLDLSKSLAVDLKLQKDEDLQPTIDISFTVDGDNSGRILPSQSQRMIVGLCMDLAVASLMARDGFIIVDEPETGLDEKVRRKFVSFLRNAAPQVILITNTAADGLENYLTTDMIRRSGKGLVAADIGFEGRSSKRGTTKSLDVGDGGKNAVG